MYSEHSKLSLEDEFRTTLEKKEKKQSPYRDLIATIILQAIDDKDVRWLKSETCQHYCNWLDIDHKEVIRKVK